MFRHKRNLGNICHDCNTDRVLTIAKQGGSTKGKKVLFIMHMYLCIATPHLSCMYACAKILAHDAQCRIMQPQLAVGVLKLFVVRSFKARSKLGSSICSSQLKNNQS